MNENTEFFLQNSVSDPCTLSKIPDSESETSGAVTFTFKTSHQLQTQRSACLLGLTAATAWTLFIPFMNSKVAFPPPLLTVTFYCLSTLGFQRWPSWWLVFWVTHWEDQGYKEQGLLEQLVPRRGSLPEWPILATCPAAQAAKHNWCFPLCSCLLSLWIWRQPEQRQWEAIKIKQVLQTCLANWETLTLLLGADVWTSVHSSY